MKAAKRQSWLPQPSRPPTAGGDSMRPISQHSVLSETSQDDNSHLPQRGTIMRKDSVSRPQTRPTSIVIGARTSSKSTTSGIERPSTSHQRTESVRSTPHQRTESLRSTPHQRTESVRSTPHQRTESVRSTPHQGTESVRSNIHKPTSSREIKPPARTTSRIARSDSTSIAPARPRTAGSGITRTASVHNEEANTDLLQKQIELLQLSIIHEDACSASRQYDQSGREALGERHTQLRDMLGEVIVLERRRAKEINLDSIARWLPDITEVPKKLATLSDIYRDALALTEHDSDYTQTLLSFQDWVLAAEECLGESAISVFHRLPEQWRHAHASTALAVRSMQRELALLPMPAMSSLAELIKGCSALLEAVLCELDLMSKLESVLCNIDAVRIENEVEAAMLESSHAPPPAKLSWRVGV